MDTRRIKKPLNQFLKNIPSFVRVDKLLVFGSHLEGNATADSDIDVVVISEDFQDMEKERRLDILYEAKEGIEPVIHPWAFTNTELEGAEELTTWWYVKNSGFRFA